MGSEKKQEAIKQKSREYRLIDFIMCRAAVYRECLFEDTCSHVTRADCVSQLWKDWKRLNREESEGGDD